MGYYVLNTQVRTDLRFAGDEYPEYTTDHDVYEWYRESQRDEAYALLSVGHEFQTAFNGCMVETTDTRYLGIDFVDNLPSYVRQTDHEFGAGSVGEFDDVHRISDDL